MLAISPGNLPRVEAIGLDERVLAFTLGISLLTGLIFGSVPALQASKPEVNNALKEGGRASTVGHHRFRSVLVVCEVALSLVLLIGAGLMIHSFVRLLNVDPGVNTQNVLTLDIGLPRTKYNGPQQVAFFNNLLERVRALPGVQSAGAVYPLPLSGAEEGMGFAIQGWPPAAPGEAYTAGPGWVTPGYFEVMGIPLLKGRVFTDGDAGESQMVVVINEAMAHKYWPDEEAIGNRVAFNRGSDGQPLWREIVGVVKDVKHIALDSDSKPAMYFSVNQYPSPFMTVVARTTGDPLQLVAAARSEVRAVDKDQPISNVKTMEQLLDNSISTRRFNMLLLSIFAGVALLLAAVGIYGVMSYSVAERTHEIGLRMALGARSRDVLKLVVIQGMVPASIGMAIGLGGALAVTRVMSNLLYEVSTTDWWTFVSVPLILTGVALVACYLPARRAAKVDPMVALRWE